jgi:uncharacterized membrane protein YfcA
MDLTVGLILLILLSGFVKGFSGFGLSIILIAVLFDMGFTSSEFLPILVPLFVVLDVILYFENKKHVRIDFKENFTIHPTTLMMLFLGTMFGTYLMTVMDVDWLKLGFAFMVLLMLFFLVRKVDIYQMRIPSERSNGFFGFGTGVLTGLFTMNGIPPSVYLMYHQYPKEKYMANLVTFLIISDVILVAVYLFKELFTFEGVLVSLKLIFIVLAGFLFGAWVRRFVSTKTFKSIVIGFLAINSLKIIFEFFFF